MLLAACAAAGTTPPTAVPPAALPTHPPPPTPDAQTPTPSPIPTAAPSPTATAVSCTKPGRVETAVFPSLTAGPLNLRLYLPPCYDDDPRLFPLLIMLPGNVHTEAIWDDLGLDEAAETLIAAAEIPPLIIAMPDGGWIAQNSSGGPGSYETVILNDLIPFVETYYCAWPAARAIGGLSRGGYWALTIAFSHPDAFAGVGGHSAALLDGYAGPDVNPQVTGVTNDLGNLRVYLDIGEQDYVIYNVRRLHEEMLTAGVAHTWVLNNGRHENAYWSSRLDAYLRWYSTLWPQERAAYPFCEKP